MLAVVASHHIYLMRFKSAMNQILHRLEANGSFVVCIEGYSFAVGWILDFERHIICIQKRAGNWHRFDSVCVILLLNFMKLSYYILNKFISYYYGNTQTLDLMIKFPYETLIRIFTFYYFILQYIPN